MITTPAYRRLRDINPAHAPAGGIDDDPIALAALQRILATDRAPAAAAHPGPLAHRWTGRRAGVLTAAAVAVLAAGVITLPSSGHHRAPGAVAYADTPPLLALRTLSAAPASRRLDLLATRAAARHPAAPGRYGYLRYRSWGLNVSAGVHGVAAAVIPATVQLWVAPDGSGRRTETDTVGQLSGDLRERGGFTGGHVDVRYRPGQLPYLPVTALPTAPIPLGEVLRQWQDGSYPAPYGLPITYLEAIDRLAAQQPIPATLQAALWRLLSTIPGLRDGGLVTDRAGRKADAIVYDTTDGRMLPTRYILLADPASGQLLGTEKILTRNPGKLPVRIPAVTSYTALLTSNSTKSLAGRR